VPVDTTTTLHQWMRYQFVRDNGHSDYVKKADKCNNYFMGIQWDPNDMALLQAQRRPALTINKIISTISNVLGEQIMHRSDISFQPRSGAPDNTASTLTKVFRQISDNNQLDWKRSDMFCDGIITSRGFLDLRLSFNDSMEGEVCLDNINPKNVLIDPDADDYDPDNWNDVFVTKWMTWQDISLLYNAEDAEYLKNRGTSFFPYGYDSIERERDRFGFYYNKGYYLGPWDQGEVTRNIRVIERQWKKLDRQLHFVDPKTGDMRPVPESWPREKIGMVMQQFGLQTTKKMVKRIRWTVTADNCVLHDDWSPFKHYTVVPYFPYFRRGKTVGLVENLLGPQEYLNKVTSQELHVINTTANSGWIVQTGKLRNMVIEELETRGAETGLVIEVDGSPDEVIRKIQPNPTPTGLDRFSYKAEDHIKNISGVTDYMAGNAREDVSAKAVAANTSRGSLNLSKPMDGIARTDFILARNILDLVQMFYTEPRIINVVSNRMTGDNEQVKVNQPDPETGEILLDLTMGEYDVVVSSTPHRETLEDSQFEQATALKELGVQIPDEVLIANSRLNKRSEIIQQMRDAAQSPDAQYKAQIQKMQAELELAKVKAESAKLEADAGLKTSKMQETQAKTATEMRGDPNEGAKLQLEMQVKQQEAGLEMQKMQAELLFMREEMELKMQEMQAKIQATQAEAAVKLRATLAESAAKVHATQAQSAAKVQASHAQAAVQTDAADKQIEQQGIKHKQGMEQAKEGHKLKLQTMQAQAKAKRDAARKPVTKAKT
jgi:hypothetical protein